MPTDDLKTWVTPLGVTLTVAGRGGPWVPIKEHTRVEHKTVVPLRIPIPGVGVDTGWYYRNGWKPPR
jgi:hypothetical protein